MNNMKLLLVIYNIAIETELFDVMEQNGLECFTKWPRVVGKGKTTGPKMDNDVWPGANSAVMLVMPENEALELMAAIQELRDEIGSHEGVKAFMMNIEKMTGDV